MHQPNAPTRELIDHVGWIHWLCEWSKVISRKSVAETDLDLTGLPNIEHDDVEHADFAAFSEIYWANQGIDEQRCAAGSLLLISRKLLDTLLHTLIPAPAQA